MQNSQFGPLIEQLTSLLLACVTLPMLIHRMEQKFLQTAVLDKPMDQVALDDIDRGILFLLQEDARHTTITEIAKKVDVSPSTVRNRIEHLEETGVIEGYFPKINYEQAHYPLHVVFVCSAPAEEREELARDALDRHGVVDVREMLTSTRNIYIEVVATNTRDLTEISNNLASMGFSIESSEILTNHYTRPWAEFEFEFEFQVT